MRSRPRQSRRCVKWSELAAHSNNQSNQHEINCMCGTGNFKLAGDLASCWVAWNMQLIGDYIDHVLMCGLPIWSISWNLGDELHNRA